jgi:hypothetical protein
MLNLNLHQARHPSGNAEDDGFGISRHGRGHIFEQPLLLRAASRRAPTILSPMDRRQMT